jgi:hypothetical protein
MAVACYVLCAAGCSAGGTASRVVERDSAGVVIVESNGPAWPEGAGWTVGDRPLVDIGVVEGPVEYQLTQVEGALRLEDGRIAVADGGSREIRIYDAAGAFISSTGGRGGAPGEYQQIVSLGYGPGDSIWVYDFGARRFTVLDGDGRVGRTVSLGGALSAVTAVGRLPDGSFVVREFWGSGSQSDAIASGLGRDPAAVALLPADGSQLDTIGVFPGREVYIGSEDGRAVMSAPLFARTTSAALHRDEIFVGDQDPFEIGVYSADGTLLRLLRVPGVDLRVTGEDVAAAVEEQLARQPAERHAMLRQHYANMDVPELRPAYGRLLVDAAGNLWVSEYAAYPVVPVSWNVFAADGGLLGEVQMPDRFQVYEIGEDYLLGVWRDEIDVEHVRIYPLEKAAEATADSRQSTADF